MDIRIAWAPVPDDTPRRDTAWRLIRELIRGCGAVCRLSSLCPRCGGPHGPVRVSGAPYLASVAYAGDLAVAGVVDTHTATAFGLDAEPLIDERRDHAGTTGLIAPQQVGDVRAWTRVESTAKADGRGLRIAPETIRVHERAGGWEAVVPGVETAFHGFDLIGPDELVISAAVLPAR